MKRKTGLAVAVAVLLMLPLVPRLVRAQMGHHGGVEPCAMMGHGDGMISGISALPIFLRAANLTPAQQAQVKTIMESSRSAMRSQSDQIRKLREQIATKLFSASAVTASDFSAETSQIANAQQQLLQNQLNVALQLRAILTPAQLQKVAVFHQQFESLHQQLRALLGPPPGDGPPPPDGPGPDAPPPA